MLRNFKEGCKVRVIYRLYLYKLGTIERIKEFDTLEKLNDYLKKLEKDIEMYKIFKRTIIDEFEEEKLIHL